MTRSVLWLRRDLRLRDHGALLAAARAGEVLPVFVLDPRLYDRAGEPRRRFLLDSLHALDADLRSYGARLVVRSGDPVEVVPDLVREVDADQVHVSADFGPYGRRRDDAVRSALGEIPLNESDSPYAVAPGRVRTGGGTAFKVFGPFYRAWLEHGWDVPAPSDPGSVEWVGARTERLPGRGPSDGVELPEAGERAAHEAWEAFQERLGDYGRDRDRADLDRTSHLSAYLKWGAIHPRTLLDGLGPDDETFRTELAWREFYAAVLSRWPESAREYFQPKLTRLPYVSGATLRARLGAWQEGRTGYPFVDAGMRQLLATGWMHNRLRMVVASFLVKDLAVEWTHGARHFMAHLVDGDLASNQHGWQWAAGSGTDAAPYFRVFNPVTQGRKFDPSGDFVRRWVPELADVAERYVHEPWRSPDGLPGDYPEPIVDHAEERRRALADYERL
ncbi:MAG: deoxyribodipyrimidine photo-lyase [Nocardioides sp.]|uniref:cryptochrome/photolyase family protein n=1 Tax=Nocardioides sp. TaxID=35761 RepID=UPI0039E3E424